MLRAAPLLRAGSRATDSGIAEPDAEGGGTSSRNLTLYLMYTFNLHISGYDRYVL